LTPAIESRTISRLLLVEGAVSTATSDKHPSGPSLKLLDLLDRKGLEALI